MNEEKLPVEIEKNIFKKMLTFLKNIFVKEQRSECEVNAELFGEVHLANLEKNIVLELQKKIENGELSEINLFKKEQEDIKKLYKEQIKQLKDEEIQYSQKLEYCRNLILMKKEKIVQKNDSV